MESGWSQHIVAKRGERGGTRAVGERGRAAKIDERGGDGGRVQMGEREREKGGMDPCNSPAQETKAPLHHNSSRIKCTRPLVKAAMEGRTRAVRRCCEGSITSESAMVPSHGPKLSANGRENKESPQPVIVRQATETRLAARAPSAVLHGAQPPPTETQPLNRPPRGTAAADRNQPLIRPARGTAAADRNPRAS
jgi:hypothetical protein